MCMDEFVNRLYDFMGIYRIFWSQNSHYRYFTNIYRYFTDILPIFTNIFSEIPTQVRVLHSRDFSVENRYFPIFGEKSAILPIFPRFFL